jgi:hypothetical protein
LQPLPPENQGEFPILSPQIHATFAQHLGSNCLLLPLK